MYPVIILTHLNMSHILIAATLSLLHTASLVPAGVQTDTSSPDLSAPHIEAQRIQASDRPVIDGVLDEEVWRRAAVATGFTQMRPDPGAAGSQRTEALLLHDENAIYVGFRNFDSEPDKIIRQLARRGDFVVSDKVFVGFDSYGDGRTAFVFGVNASGVKYDLLIYDDVREDPSWEAVWDVAVAELPEGGWSAEFRIPLSQLRFTTAEGPQEWGVQFLREIARNQEQSFWSPVTPESSGNVSLFGRLIGIEGLRAPRRLEVLPYAAADLARVPGDLDNPFYDPTAVGVTAGLDMKVGLSSTLTLSGTINPDFGQVEADPAVVNLSAFETFFAERRPFFVEGADVFQFGSTRAHTAVFRPTYFYSRRIGRAPQRRLAGSQYAFVDSPEQTTIAAAGKVSGKVGPWSIGVLSAVTMEEQARFLGGDGEMGRDAVEPMSSYSVARVRRDMRGGQTVVGGLITATHRSLSEPAFESLLADRAYVGGVDFEHTFGQRAWAVGGVFAGSTVLGDPAFITRLQHAPQRYFQRPDATHLTVDADRTSLSGAAAEVSIARISGKLRGSMTFNAVTAGFDTNDLGFQARADGYGVSGIVLYNENEVPVSWLRRIGGNINSAIAWNGAGDIMHRAIAGNVNGQFSNFWYGGTYLNVSPLPIQSDRLTRGGPLAERPAQISQEIWFGSDERRSIRAHFWTFGRHEFDGEGGHVRNVGATLTLRPSPNANVSIGPSIGYEQVTDQYVGALADEVATATFGRRYVFATLQQHTAAMDLRVNWTFTPNLSLQFFGRPYLTSGQYASFKELETPRTRDFTVYGVDRGTITETSTGYAVDPGDGGPEFGLPNPNFAFRSIRANAVLRWEYRPGSTVFFVWQQQRQGVDQTGSFDIGRDFGALMREPAHNVFLIKLSYWLTP